MHDALLDGVPPRRPASTAGQAPPPPPVAEVVELEGGPEREDAGMLVVQAVASAWLGRALEVYERARDAGLSSAEARELALEAVRLDVEEHWTAPDPAEGGT